MNLNIPSPTGTTRLLAILGHPIAQVQAPMLMNQLFLDRGADAIMVAVDASPDRLGSVLRGLKCIDNLVGMLVTVPHKFAAVAFADACSKTVELAGSANALRKESDGRWYAENFDGLGFVAGLKSQGHAPHDMQVSLVGAGGAGVAIAAALVQEGIRHLNVIDASRDKAQALVDRLNRYQAGVATVAKVDAVSGSDLVINATPMGLQPEDPLPFLIDTLHDQAIVADIIMKPAETLLLRVAKERGLRTHAGAHMLLPQISMYGQFFGV